MCLMLSCLFYTLSMYFHVKVRNFMKRTFRKSLHVVVLRMSRIYYLTKLFIILLTNTIQFFDEVETPNKKCSFNPMCSRDIIGLGETNRKIYFLIYKIKR